MTPYSVPATNEQTNFNAALCRTRVLIEQTYGILKQQFQCLHHGLRCSSEQAVDYITACSILHNIGINRSDIFINNNCLDSDAVQCIYNEIPVPHNIDGYRKRNAIAFFSVKIDVCVKNIYVIVIKNIQHINAMSSRQFQLNSNYTFFKNTETHKYKTINYLHVGYYI